MADEIRVTQEAVGAVGSFDPNVRVTQTYLDFPWVDDANLRVTQNYLDFPWVDNALLRVTQNYIELLYFPGTGVKNYAFVGSVNGLTPTGKNVSDMSTPTPIYFNGFDFTNALQGGFDGWGGFVGISSGGRGTLGNFSKCLTIFDGGNAMIWNRLGLGLSYTIAAGFAIKLPNVANAQIFNFGVDQRTFSGGGALLSENFVGGLSIGCNTMAGFTFTVGSGSGQTAYSPNGLYYTNSWGYLEIKVNASYGSGTYTFIVEAKWNGVAITLNGASSVTMLQSATFNTGTDIAEFGFRWSNGGATVTYDDFYIATDYLGDVGIAEFLPTAAGDSSDWTPNGAGANYTKVDEDPPDGDTTYISTPIASPVRILDLYHHGMSLSAACVIFAAFQLTWGKSIDSTNTLYPISPTCKPTTTEFDSIVYYPQLYTAYGQSVFFWQNNPDTGLPWTPAQLNAAQFGIRYQNP